MLLQISNEYRCNKKCSMTESTTKAFLANRFTVVEGPNGTWIT